MLKFEGILLLCIDFQEKNLSQFLLVKENEELLEEGRS